MKYCTHCGRKNPDSAKFCRYCGMKLSTNDNTQQTNNDNLVNQAKEMKRYRVISKHKNINRACIIAVIFFLVLVGGYIYSQVSNHSMSTSSLTSHHWAISFFHDNRATGNAGIFKFSKNHNVYIETGTNTWKKQGSFSNSPFSELKIHLNNGHTEKFKEYKKVNGNKYMYYVPPKSFVYDAMFVKD